MSVSGPWYHLHWKPVYNKEASRSTDTDHSAMIDVLPRGNGGLPARITDDRKIAFVLHRGPATQKTGPEGGIPRGAPAGLSTAPACCILRTRVLVPRGDY